MAELYRIRRFVHRAFVVEPRPGGMWQGQMRRACGTPEVEHTEMGTRQMVIDAARWFSEKSGIPVLIRDDNGRAIGLGKGVR